MIFGFPNHGNLEKTPIKHITIHIHFLKWIILKEILAIEETSATLVTIFYQWFNKIKWLIKLLIKSILYARHTFWLIKRYNTVIVKGVFKLLLQTLQLNILL